MKFCIKKMKECDFISEYSERMMILKKFLGTLDIYIEAFMLKPKWKFRIPILFSKIWKTFQGKSTAHLTLTITIIHKIDVNKFSHLLIFLVFFSQNTNPE